MSALSDRANTPPTSSASDCRSAMTSEVRKLRKLGVDREKAYCAVCGEHDLDMLRRAHRAIVEKHHILGLHEGPIIVLCLNHHAKLTAAARLWPKRLLESNRNPLERLAAAEFGQRDYCHTMAGLHNRKGLWLLELANCTPTHIYSSLGDPFTEGNKS
jgi:hypothetical protein